MAPRSNRDLVRACLAGDEGAWEELLDRYGRLIWSVALQLGASPLEAEEVFQRTWVGVVERIGTLNRPESLASWIASTARHHTYQLFDEARRAGRVPVWDGAEDEALRREATVEPAEDDLLALERLELLREAVAALDPRCRRLIELLFLTEPRPDYRTIASRTGLAVGSIGPIRARCLEKLRRTMERLYQGDVSPDSLEDER